MSTRVQIVPEPTPLTALPRLSGKLGIDLHVKRDDLAGPTFGGNKSRQLEFYFGAASEAQADTILITGAVQSNFVRLAAAVARSQGMHPIVQLEERVRSPGHAYQSSGNVQLSRILGAEILRYPEGEDEAGADRALYAKAEELRGQGKRPYVIPLSEDHPPIGALGYVRAAQELLAQDAGFDVFVVGSGSGATHAGLLAGLRGEGSKALVIGSCVRRDQSLQTARIGRVIRRLEALYTGANAVSSADIVTRDGALAPGYGKLGTVAAEAMRMMAQSEGLILDPVYTSKAFAAIPALVADGTIPKGSRVCFVHTGGLAALFAYEDALAEAF
jgi:1-aminocyclopropane-1-carboxylate deaminase/D-cysteine desulfhydrase-like pyridoxal-dependent ACC family enzyme